VRRWVIEWISAVRDLLLPRCGCAFCSRPLAAPEDFLCPACAAELAASRLGYQPCRHCATFIPLGMEVCRSCDVARQGTACPDRARDGAACQDTTRQDTACQDTTRQGTACPDRARDGAACQDTTRQDTACQDTTRQGTACPDRARDGAACQDTTHHDSWLDISRAAYPYQGVIKDRIRQLKYHRGVWLAEPLGRLMLDAALANGLTQADLVIPVPLHPLRQRERGYNQAERLARVVAKGLSLPLDTRTLIRCRNTPSQTSLKRAERLLNPENAFALIRAEPVIGKRILLVDDIFTTGATVAACARVLRQGGATSVCAILCAAGKQQNIAK